MGRVLDAIAPVRLGGGFRWLLASSWVSNLGDGIVLAAGPLLVASETDDELLVAMAALLQWLPPMVFGLWAGAIADRVDRRLLIIVVDLLRVGVLVALGVSIVADQVSIGLVLSAMFLLGTAETFADTTSSTLLPMLVRRDDLGVANARMITGFITVNQLAGPPIGGALFAAGRAWPFATQAALVLAGATLISRLRLPPHGRRDDHERKHLLHDVAEGFRWVLHHAAVRTLVLTIFTFNITYGAAWSVLVLYATERLGLGDIGFGLVTTVTAAGGFVSTLAYAWIIRHVSLGDLMRIGLIIETLTHLALAVTTTPWVAMIVFFVFGAHAFVWATTSITVRQRAVPAAVQGRVAGVNQVAVYGGLVIGSGIGGVIARRFGIAGPYWFGFVGSAIFVVLIWRQLAHIAHADEADPTLDPVGRGGFEPP